MIEPPSAGVDFAGVITGTGGVTITASTPRTARLSYHAKNSSDGGMVFITAPRSRPIANSGRLRRT